jgi:hypothetical protein
MAPRSRWDAREVVGVEFLVLLFVSLVLAVLIVIARG